MVNVFFVLAVINFTIMLTLIQSKKYKDIAIGLLFVELILVYLGITSTPL